MEDQITDICYKNNSIQWYAALECGKNILTLSITKQAAYVSH
jgi:hypothetical protein